MDRLYCPDMQTLKPCACSLDKGVAKPYNNSCIGKTKLARVSELADERDSKSCAARRVGSSPTSGTIRKTGLCEALYLFSEVLLYHMFSGMICFGVE